VPVTVEAVPLPKDGTAPAGSSVLVALKSQRASRVEGVVRLSGGAQCWCHRAVCIHHDGRIIALVFRLYVGHVERAGDSVIIRSVPLSNH